MSDLIQHDDTPENTTEYIKLAQLKKGDSLSGTYKRSFTDAKYQATTHYFLAADGRSFAINGNTMLNKKMAMVAPETSVKISYRGTQKVKTPKGGLVDSHLINVNINDEARTPILLQKADVDAAVAAGADSEKSFRK